MLSESIARMRRSFDEFTGTGLAMAGPVVEKHVRALESWEAEARRLEEKAESPAPESPAHESPAPESPAPEPAAATDAAVPSSSGGRP